MVSPRTLPSIESCPAVRTVARSAKICSGAGAGAALRVQLQLLGTAAAIAAAVGGACTASVLADNPLPPTLSVMLAVPVAAAAASAVLAVMVTLCRRWILGRGLLLLVLFALTAAGTALVIAGQAYRCGPTCDGAAAALFVVEAMPSVVLGEMSINSGCFSLQFCCHCCCRCNQWLTVLQSALLAAVQQVGGTDRLEGLVCVALQGCHTPQHASCQASTW